MSLRRAGTKTGSHDGTKWRPHWMHPVEHNGAWRSDPRFWKQSNESIGRHRGGSFGHWAPRSSAIQSGYCASGYCEWIGRRAVRHDAVVRDERRAFAAEHRESRRYLHSEMPCLVRQAQFIEHVIARKLVQWFFRNIARADVGERCLR